MLPIIKMEELRSRILKKMMCPPLGINLLGQCEKTQVTTMYLLKVRKRKGESP
jgi:hypothetical protein